MSTRFDNAMTKKAMKDFSSLLRVLEREDKAMHEIKYVTVYMLDAIPIREGERLYLPLR